LESKRSRARLNDKVDPRYVFYFFLNCWKTNSYGRIVLDGIVLSRR